MQENTKAEIVIVGGVGVLLLWVYLANKKAGAGTGLENFWPSFLGGGSVGSGAGPGSALGSIAPVAGDVLNYTPGTFSLPNYAPTVPVGAPSTTAPSSCGCGCGDTQATQYASNDGLAAFLASLPPVQAATNITTAALSYFTPSPAPANSNTGQIISDMNYGSGSLVMGATAAQTGAAMQNQFAAWSAPGSTAWE